MLIPQLANSGLVSRQFGILTMGSFFLEGRGSSARDGKPVAPRPLDFEVREGVVRDGSVTHLEAGSSVLASGCTPSAPRAQVSA